MHNYLICTVEQIHYHQCDNILKLIYILLKDNYFTEFFLFSVKAQYESAIGIHISTPF